MKCPIYNDNFACSRHPDCLFNKNGGCAIVLAATISDDNQRAIQGLKNDIEELKFLLYKIERKMK